MVKVRMKKNAGLRITRVVGSGEKPFTIEQDEEKEISDELYETLKDSLMIVKEPDADEKISEKPVAKTEKKESK